MIKHLLLTVAATIAFMFSYSQSGRVGIGTSNPEQKLDVAGSAKANDKVIGTRGFVAGTVTADTAKAIFSTDITNKGFYIPRLTTSQKNTLGGTLGTSNKGLLVFDTDLNRTDFWDGTAWKAVGDGAGGPPTGTAGGDLTGTYPNPNIGNSKVTSTHILDGTITGTDIQNNTIDLTQKVNNVLPVSNGGTGVNTITGAVIGNGSSPMSGVAASAGNQVLRRNNGNTAYEFAQVQYSDVAGTPSALPPSGTAGGDLTGSYPNPTVGAGKIDNGKLANDAVTTGKILDGTITAADLATTGVTANTYNNVTVNSKGQVTGGSNTAYLTGNQNITLSGDVSGSGTTAISTTIGNNTVTNTKLSDMAQNTLKGRYSSGSGDPEDLTPAQALNVLGITAPTGDNLGNHTATTALDMVGNAINRAVQINTNGDHLELMTNRVDDNTYEWIGYYSGGTRQGIMLWDGAWSGANNLTNEFSLTAENNNLLTLNTNNNHIALMPKNGNVGIGTASPNGTLDVRGATFVGSSNTNQQIKFTDGWSGYPDGSNGSEIANDVGSFKALMIVGNKSAGGSRQVKLWDYLTVNGGMSVTGLGSGIVKATGGVLGIANAGDLPSHTHTWSQVTSKPAAWLDGSNLIADNANFNNSVPSGFYQGYNATNAPGTSWYNMLNVRHSNPGNDHGFQIAASYYDEKIWTRTYQGGTGANDGTFTPWAELQTSRSSSNANWTMAMHGQSSDDDLGFGWTSVVDDGIWGTVMPFSIQINGTNYSDLTLNSNGTVVFGSQSANLGYSYGTLPNGVTTLPFIAWYWRDMSTRYRYGTVGSSPNRVFIIDFDSNAYGTSDDVDGQIEIHETSGLINVFYRVMEPNVNGQNATIGFQLNGGNSAKAYPITYNGKVFDDNRNPQSWSVSPVR